MDIEAAIAKQGDFSLRLFHRLSSLSSSHNVVFSPVSVHIVLSLLSAGAKAETLDQLTSFLGSSSSADLRSLASQIIASVLADASVTGGPLVSFANGVWVDRSLSLKDSFRNVASGSYRAEVGSVDFQSKAVEAAASVNNWVDKQTNGLINELLPSGSVDSSTKLVFGNALYFKGAWNEKFDSSETKDYEFQLLDGNSVQVPFMTSSRKQYVSSFLDFKVLRLPYKQGEDSRQFSMYIFLPDAKDGLWSLAEKLGSGTGFLERHLPMQKATVEDLKVPTFKVSFGLELSASLKDLGLDLPFGDRGDLTEMVDSALGHKLSVSDIFHKSYIEFNEEGTEAASATAAVVILRSAPMQPVTFVADHPFIFIIREDATGVVMFTGHVLNPRLSG